LLKTLNDTPEGCWKADAYWEVGGEVCFVEVWVTAKDPVGRVGAWARWSDGEPPMLHLAAVLNEPYVTRAAFEAVMSEFRRRGSPEVYPQPAAVRGVGETTDGSR
jgi:hypothetical protein